MAHEEYIRHTDGDTAILFIHGFLGSPEHFNKFIERIPQSFAVYNILLKGHGGTVRDFGSASMAEWKRQVGLAIDMLSQKYSQIIICAHSMGTFLAMEEAVKHPHLIKSIFLLAVPFKIAVRSTAFINTIKSFFNLIPEGDKKGLAYQAAHSVKLNKRIWEYASWIPRYLELFKESKRSRETVLKVSVPCRIFFSKLDELVSMKSEMYVPEIKNITVDVLENSAHFIYSDKDFCFLLDEFENVLSRK